jgi:hypothetical protein
MTRHACGRCGAKYDSMQAALLCCDPDFDTDPDPPADDAYGEAPPAGVPPERHERYTDRHIDLRTDGGEEPTCPECGTGPDGLLFDPQPSPASNRYICAECEHDWDADTTPKTHVDEDGLRIPRHLRGFDQQIVIRTPASTLQHFGSDPLDAYYSMVTPDDFGPVEEFRNPQNPDLAPNKVSIKPQGEDAEVFEVEVKADIRCDGGGCPKCGGPTRLEGGCPSCLNCPWSKCGGGF